MLAILSVSAALAASPTGSGFIVGGASVGGALVGTAAGGLAGVGIGALTCTGNSFECWGPAIGGGLGAAGGFVAGGVVAGGLAAKKLDLDPVRTRRWSLAALGTGGAIIAASAAAGWWDGQTVGTVVAAAGIPVAAGLAAATDPSLQVTPAYLPSPGGQGRYGLALRGQF